jgi:hypothetical protein
LGDSNPQNKQAANYNSSCKTNGKEKYKEIFFKKKKKKKEERRKKK